MLKQAKLDELRPGQKLWLDSGFTCIERGWTMCFIGPSGPYFLCNHGQHMLDGQVADLDGNLVGVFVKNEKERGISDG